MNSTLVKIVAGASFGAGLGLTVPATLQEAGPTDSFELRDEAGRVVCRVGKLDGGGVGIEVHGDKEGAGLLLRNDGSLSELVLTAQSGHSVELRAKPGGSKLLVGGVDSAAVEIVVDTEGSRLELRDRTGANKVTVSSNAIGSRLNLESSNGPNDNSIGWLFESAGDVASMTASCDGKPGLQAYVRRGVGASVIVGGFDGESPSGVRIQSITGKGALMAVTHEGSSFIARSNEKDGAEFAVTRPNGKVAVRMGVTKGGELLDQVLDAEGDPVLQRSSEKKK